MSLYQTRAEKLCKRRQEDIKDEASDCSTALSMYSSHLPKLVNEGIPVGLVL